MTTEKNTISEWLAVSQSAAKGERYANFFKRVNRLLQKPARQRAAVTITKLNRHTKEGDNVLIPRKVLSTGKMDHKISIAALEYSTTALKELKGSGCEILDIKDMAKRQRIKLIV
ncbi:MAG: 50S ribosomal protein L18e [Candidatus Marsarchaeota archaeon]|nr:50S ribosomal protein L18e [Candidatus Marsarchaeota archaeon]